MADDKLKVFSIIHNWPGDDEGNYAWAGEAIDLDHARERCLDAMIADDLAMDDVEDSEEIAERREEIKDCGEAEVYEGADIWQASTMMQAIEKALVDYPDNMTNAMRALEHARDKACGFRVELEEAQVWFNHEPCDRSARCLKIVATRLAEDDRIEQGHWQDIMGEIHTWMIESARETEQAS